MRAMQTAQTAGCKTLPYALMVLLLACGPGSAVPPENNDTDDDAETSDDDAADDDTGDDDANANRGTVAVTLHSLAIEPEGSNVTAEIVLDEVPTGTFAPATIEVPTGSHTITVLREGFVSPTEQISVATDAQTDIECVLGRDLTGTWQKMEENGELPLFDDPFEVTMYFGQVGDLDGVAHSPCPTGVWVYELGPLCLMTGDRVWSEHNDGVAVYSVNGTITDRGMRVVYTTTFPEFPDEPGYTDVYARVE